MPRLSKPPEIPTRAKASPSTASSSSATPSKKAPKPTLKPGKPSTCTKITKIVAERNIADQPRTQTAPAPPLEPTFICTICWQSQFPPSKSKLLGTSSRIVCKPCWKAVLDLSICWVCGECIVRGDEVVSLGWCFWHRTCFGCLVCGGKMDLDVFKGEDGGWGAWNDCGNDGKEGSAMRNRMIGVELDRVPLCTDCDVEMEGKGKKEVVERGLETVSRFDGGLSRDRLEMLSEEKEETRRGSRSRGKRSRFRASRGLERELKRFINGSTSRWSEFVAADDPEAQAALIPHAAEMGISEDGNADDENDRSDNESTDFHQTKDDSPNIYVSVLDPVGEPAFKPSKTKPLPKWLSLLPNNVHRERRQWRKERTSEPNPQSHEMERLDGRSTSIVDCCPSENDIDDPPAPLPTETTPQDLSRASIEPTPAPIGVPGSSKAARKGRVMISVDREREYVFGDVDHRESIYINPPEHTSGPLTKGKPPYPPPRPPMPRKRGTSYHFSRGLPQYIIPDTDEDSYSAVGADLETAEPSRETPPNNVCHGNLQSDNASPYWVVQSSEYLERYKPKSAETKYEKYVAKQREPVIERIKRQRVGKQSPGEVEEEAGEKRCNGNKKFKLGNDECGMDTRREDLKKELRNLFCEE